MSTSPLYPLSAVFEFGLPSGQPPELLEAFRSIPGVMIAKSGDRLWCPAAVARLLASALELIPGAVVRKVPAPVELTRAADEFLGKLTRCELLPHIWPSFMLPFQKEAVFWNYARGGGHIWAAPGAGKTIMALTWMLAESGAGMFVTKSSARLQVRAQVKRFAHEGYEPFVIKSASEIRKKDRWHSLPEYLEWCQQRGQRPFVILGWEGLTDMLDEALAQEGALHLPGIPLGTVRSLPVLRDASFNMMTGSIADAMQDVPAYFNPVSLVLDEVHMGKQERRVKWDVRVGASGDDDFALESTPLKNRSAAAALLSEWAHRRLGTTATPVGHRLRDLWGQLSLIQPKAWGMTSRRFLMRYCAGRDGKYGGLEANGMTNVEELKERLASCVYQIPYATSHGQLPPKRRMVTVIPAAQLQKSVVNGKALEHEIERLSIALGRTGDEQAKVGAISRLNELRLIEAASRKRGVVCDKVREYKQTGKGKVLVMSGRKEDVEALRDNLDKSFPEDALWTITGEDAMEERARIQEAYMAHPGPCCLIGTRQSLGVALDLQDTDVLLVTMLAFTPWELEQLEGRTHRLGMTRSVLIEYLIGEGTYDQRVKAIVIDKMPAVEAITDGQNSITGIAGDFRQDAGRSERVAQLALAIAQWNDDWNEED